MTQSAESGAPWFRPFPDLTTEAIVRIDAELVATQEHRERLARESLCLTCGERGLHTHVTPPGNGDSK